MSVQVVQHHLSQSLFSPLRTSCVCWNVVAVTCIMIGLLFLREWLSRELPSSVTMRSKNLPTRASPRARGFIHTRTQRHSLHKLTNAHEECSWTGWFKRIFFCFRKAFGEVSAREMKSSRSDSLRLVTIPFVHWINFQFYANTFTSALIYKM